MVGDESALPAIAASLEAVPDGVLVVVRLLCDGPEHELDLPTPGRLDLQWLHRTGEPEDVDLLVESVRSLAFPRGRVHAFVHGEADEIRAPPAPAGVNGAVPQRHVLLALLAPDHDRRGLAPGQARLRGGDGLRRRLTG